MSESSENPRPAEQGWQAPDSPPADAAPAPDAPGAPAAGASPVGAPPAPDAPSDRPPPYQGAYGGMPAYPAQSEPGPGQPPQGHPGYGPPAGAPPGWGNGLAGRGARLGAAILDGLIIGAVSVPLVIQAVRWDELKDAADSGRTLDAGDIYDIPRLLAGYAVAFVIGFAYYTILHARSGQTVGKRAVGIRLVRADDHAAVSWGQAALRQGFVYVLTIGAAIVNLLGPFGGILGLASVLDNAWILWDGQRQALHDKVAKTVVVKTAPWVANPYARN